METDCDEECVDSACGELSGDVDSVIVAAVGSTAEVADDAESSGSVLVVVAGKSSS